MYKVLREITEDNITGSNTSSSDLCLHLIYVICGWGFLRSHLILEPLASKDMLLVEMEVK